jgi:hypothetical protein
MSLKNYPEGQNYIGVSAGDAPGSRGVDSPTVLQVTFAAAPNRLSLYVGRRSVGTIANLKTIYTPGDTLTFAATGVEDSVSWTENTNPSDKTGRFEVFVWVKDQSGVAGGFACRAERQIGSKIVRGPTRRPSISTVAGATVSAANIGVSATIPLPVVTGGSVGVSAVRVATTTTIPAPSITTLSGPQPATVATRIAIPQPNLGGSNPRPATIAVATSIGVTTHETAFALIALGAFDIPVGTTAWTWRFVAWRESGLAPLEVHHLLIVPIDESFISLEWTAAADVSQSAVKTFTIDSIAGEAYWGTYGNEQAGGTLTWSGSLALKSNTAQRLVVQAAADSGWPARTTPQIVSDAYAPSSPVTVHVRPRYRDVR